MTASANGTAKSAIAAAVRATSLAAGQVAAAAGNPAAPQGVKLGGGAQAAARVGIVSPTVRRGRRVRSAIASGWMALSVVVALTPLVLVLGWVVSKGAGALSWEFLTQAEPFSFNEAGGGYWNGIKGTLKLLALASAVALPVGVLAAVWLVEFGRGPLAAMVRFLADVMTGVPSIFIGVFVYSFIVVRNGHFSTWSGAIALALLMLPIVVRASEEVLRLVPGELREASLALGVPAWRTIIGVVLPTALPGLVTACMLAVARAAGETAPLLFTSFGNRFVTGWSEFDGPEAALPLLIYRGARSAYEPAQQRAWAGALVLVALILVLTITARLVAARKGPSRI